MADLHPTALDGVDPLSYGVFQAFMRNIRLHRQLMAQTLAADGARPGQVVCLRMLAAHDSISQRDLARALHLTPPSVTAMLQRMERDGIVERRPDEADQRVSRVRLTVEGRRLEERQRATFARFVNMSLEWMHEDDRRELERLLQLLADGTERALAASAGDEPGPPTGGARP